MMTILSTDMSVHFQWLPKFQQLLDRLQHSNAQTDEEDDDLGKVTEDVDCQTRLLLCQALIKCADISNPVSSPVCSLIMY
jgi:3'5'-cyclic nucleotide phosphodiesterase